LCYKFIHHHNKFIHHKGHKGYHEGHKGRMGEGERGREGEREKIKKEAVIYNSLFTLTTNLNKPSILDFALLPFRPV
jgi:hypothetical protein